MRATVILCKFCLQKVESFFTGSFSPECLTAPDAEEVISSINVILQGPFILQADANNDDNIDLDAKMQICSYNLPTAHLQHMPWDSPCKANIHNNAWERSRNNLSSLSRSEDAQGSMAEKKTGGDYTCTRFVSVLQSCYGRKASDISTSMQALRSGWGCSTNQFTDQCFCSWRCGQYGWTEQGEFFSWWVPWYFS